MSAGAIITTIIMWAIFIGGLSWCSSNFKKTKSKWE
jgi:hypothetical protein